MPPTGPSASLVRWASTPNPGLSSSTTTGPSGRCLSAISGTSARSGCNAMVRPVFGRVSAPRRGGSAHADRSARVAHLDRDRALVEAAQADPLRFDALYRRYLAQVYSYAFYELGDHH